MFGMMIKGFPTPARRGGDHTCLNSVDEAPSNRKQMLDKLPSAKKSRFLPLVQYSPLHPGKQTLSPFGSEQV